MFFKEIEMAKPCQSKNHWRAERLQISESFRRLLKGKRRYRREARVRRKKEEKRHNRTGVTNVRCERQRRRSEL